MEMALTGDMFAAAQAQEFGLINRHVPRQNLHQEVKQLADKIASRSAQGIRGGKAAFYQQIDMPLAQSFAFANEAMACAVTSEGDAEEGRQAFIEKRPPTWGDA
jgi:enoyl-CoA hydratase/carnithine racemase